MLGVVIALLLLGYVLLVSSWIAPLTGEAAGAAPDIPPHLRYRHVVQIWEVLAGGLVSGAIVVAIFAFISRTLESHEALIIRLGVIASLALLFNFAPRWIGPLIVADGGLRVIPLLAPSYRVQLPLMNLWLAATFLLVLAQLKLSRRRRALSWARIALGLLGAVVLSRIIFGIRFSHVDFILKPILGLVLLLIVIVPVARGLRPLQRSETSRRPIA